MPKLYVANATQQVMQLNFWVPDTPRPITAQIDIGGQTLIMNRDIPRETIDSIIKQNRHYGLCTVAEGERDPEFSGLCYSIDKPITLTALYTLVHRKRGILAQQGKRMREEAAVATNAAIDRTIEEERLPVQLNELDMSLQEVARDPRDDSPEMAEGVRVSRRPEIVAQSKTPRGRAAARAAARR